MSRTINDIYQQAVTERNKRLELNEFNSDSKMSIMNGITWVVAAVIYSFEVILDAFTVDISEAMNSRINGTPNYYASVLLQYQKGDTLMVRPDGLAFGYPSVDESKRIINQVSYVESWDDNDKDYKLILKTATGSEGALQPLLEEDLIAVNSYIRNFAFAGTNVSVVSQLGDVLIPKVSVYYTGAVPEAEIYDNLVAALKDHISTIPFDSSIYVSKVLQALKSVDHVTDVYINEDEGQGVYIAKYNTDNILQPTEKISRVGYTASGFVRESSKSEQEKDIANFRESIKLIVGK